MLRLHLCERKPGRTDVKALHIKCGLDRDRIDLAKQRVHKIQCFMLKLTGKVIAVRQAILHDIVGLFGRYIGENGNDADTAQ